MRVTWLLAALAVAEDTCPNPAVSLLQLRKPPLLRKEPGVGIVGLGDSRFVEKYAANADSMRCYAKRHGYDFVLINPEDEDYKGACAEYSVFFFRKHCLVATFLQTKPPGYTAFVMDLDVLVMRSDLGLDHWTRGAREQDADLVFYERIWNPEVMAGNYLARSSNFSVNFLQHWASYEFRQPRGFSSADNGAIHLALLDALDLERKGCSEQYARLEQGVDALDLDDPKSEYWSFVRCTKRALHPPRRWQAPGGAITLLPRAHAWAVDGFVQGNHIVRHENGPVFYHGIKNMDDSREFFDFEKCEARPARLESRSDFTKNFVRMLAEQHKRGDELFLYTDAGATPCVSQLECESLDASQEAERADGYPYAGELVSLAPRTRS